MGKIAEIHQDLQDHLDRHIAKYKSGKMDAETLGSHCVKAGMKIASNHGIEPFHAHKFVSDYVESELKESFSLNENLYEMVHLVHIMKHPETGAKAHVWATGGEGGYSYEVESNHGSKRRYSLPLEKVIKHLKLNGWKEYNEVMKEEYITKHISTDELDEGLKHVIAGIAAAGAIGGAILNSPPTYINGERHEYASSVAPENAQISKTDDGKVVKTWTSSSIKSSPGNTKPTKLYRPV